MRNIFLISIVFIITLLSALNGYSQSKVYEVRGSLRNLDGYPIQFAHIVNINKSAGCISDTAGRFRMLMLASDTVKITCIGYESTGFTLKKLKLDSQTEAIDLGKIVMVPKIYELSAVSIYDIRWKSFLYDYEHVEEKQTPYYVKQIDHWKENLINVEEIKEISQGARGVGFALNFDFKKRKAEKKIAEFERQEALNIEAAEKYNPQVVAEVTGLPMEEAEKFYWHFNLDRDFILQRNDYDIHLLIKQLYKEYKR